MAQELATRRSDWAKGSATNFTTASFSATFGQSTFTEPTGDKWIDLNKIGAKTCNGIIFKFFGAGSNNNTGKYRIWGASTWYNRATSRTSWEFLLLAEFAVIFGNLAGIAGCMITNSDFECDTITLTYGNDDVTVSIVSPGNDVRGAHAMIDKLSVGYVGVETDLDSSATSLKYAYLLI